MQYSENMKNGNVCLLVIAVLALTAAAWASSAKEIVIDRFDLPHDGIGPASGLVLDANGNLYGTTRNGGTRGFGTVFELSPPAVPGGTWTETVLYNFQSGSDGAFPVATLIFDATGNLYGTTLEGGAAAACSSGCGTVFQLAPPTGAGGTWTETILYKFAGGTDGALPSSSLVFDSAGNLYGTTAEGGKYTDGTVFQLTPPASPGDAWTESLLHIFSGNPDGKQPVAGLLFDAQGNLYGTTQLGGKSKAGTVFKLHRTESGIWTERIIYNFAGGSDGSNPTGNLLLDKKGNLYSTTSLGGSGSCSFVGTTCGTVFQLTPPSTSGDPWTETVLYSFQGLDGDFPESALVFDKLGNLFGTTVAGGSGPCTLNSVLVGCGSVFQLTPPATAGDPWTENVLYSFLGDPDDGANPLGAVVFGTKGGALFGTTSAGGHHTASTGTVFELGPVP